MLADRVGGYQNLLAIEADGLMELLHVALAGESQAAAIEKGMREMAAQRRNGG